MPSREPARPHIFGTLWKKTFSPDPPEPPLSTSQLRWFRWVFSNFIFREKFFPQTNSFLERGRPRLSRLRDFKAARFAHSEQTRADPGGYRLRRVKPMYFIAFGSCSSEAVAAAGAAKAVAGAGPTPHFGTLWKKTFSPDPPEPPLSTSQLRWFRWVFSNFIFREKFFPQTNSFLERGRPRLSRLRDFKAARFAHSEQTRADPGGYRLRRVKPMYFIAFGSCSSEAVAAAGAAKAVAGAGPTPHFWYSVEKTFSPDPPEPPHSTM